MAPSAVNDSARAEMASMAMWRDDNSGALSATLATATYSVTSNQTFDALAAGDTVTIQLGSDMPATALLNIDSLGAKPLRPSPNVDFAGGEYKSGTIVKAVYKTSNSGEWIVEGWSRYQPNGTVALPAYSFDSDPDSGIYRIGANNIGVGVNGAKVLDIGTTGLNVIGAVSQNGTALSPFPQGVGMVNGTITESHTGNAVTFALKTLAGADPSSTDPVTFGFKTLTTGSYVVAQATSALSLTISSGSTMGFTSGVAGKLWIVVFYDSGTLRIGAINCLSGTNIYPLGATFSASSTAEGGLGAADSAQVFYTDTAVTSKAFVVVAYASYESGVATAGSWAASPTRLQLASYGIKLPGDEVQRQRTVLSTFASGSTAIPLDGTPPQITEGDEYITRSITPTSAANVLEIEGNVAISNGTLSVVAAALFQDSTAGSLTSIASAHNAGASDIGITLRHEMLAGTTSSTTFRVRAGSSSGTTNFNGWGGAGVFSNQNSYLRVREIVA